ncbi:BTAD domain-containing putative transcriptional regulator [Micromonospora sp. NPDC051925]|uniref:BTAD domain-containing putative transcriptional regulator n=1 Tax=Micromonospora sp. NPDC051925 TaxID=3364288 RepID=UPI0037CAF666
MLIRLTGLVAIEQLENGEVRHLSSAQAQVAFARLTLERANGTGRDQLADTVWPDGLPDTWASALRSVVSRVRAFVAGGDASDDLSVISQSGRYLLRLPPDAVVDLELAESSVATATKAFADDDFTEARRRAASAVACLRRPFLSDHEGEWVTSVRQRLDELLVAALEIASLASSALGEDREALRYASEAVQRGPLRESAHRCRMAAHVAAGNRAEALHAYNTLRRVLVEELGVDPAPETQALYLELLVAPAVATPSPRELFRAKPGTAAPFIGRRTELTMLAECWAQAVRGDSHLILISGEPGIGKTRLITAAASRAGLAAAVVLHGRCEPSSRQPFQPVIEALSGYVAATPADAVPDVGRSAAATLAALTAGEPPCAADADQLGVLTNVLIRLARASPVLLVLDDLDLAGEDTLALLRQLLRRRRGICLLVVATASNPVHYPPAFAVAVRDMDREGHLLRSALTGLVESDVATLIGQVVPAAAVRSLPSPRRLVADTAGNPYLLLSLLRWYCERQDRGEATAEELPSGVHDHANGRLAALRPASRRLLTAAALAGPTFELDLTAAAAELSAAEAMDELDVLLAAGLVRPVRRGGPGLGEYGFCHDVLRRSVGAQCHADRRRALHRRFVDAIEAQRAADLDRYSATLARHCAAAAVGPGDARAVRWGWAAGSRAFSDGAHREAVQMHRLALQHVPADEPGLRAEALMNLGLAQRAAGDGDAEQTLFDGALQALHSGRPDVAAQAALALADGADERSRLRGEATALVEALLRRPAQQAAYRPARPGRPTPRGVLDDLTLGRLLARHKRFGGRVTAGPASAAAIAALIQELHQSAGPERLQRRLELSADLSDVADAVGDRRARVIAAHHLATAADLTGRHADRDRALAVLAAEADGTRGNGDPLADALLVDHAVAVAVTEGRFTDAVATARLAGQAVGLRQGRTIQPAPGGLAGRQMHVAGWLRGVSWPATGGPGGDRALAEVSLAALVAGERGRPHLTLRALATGAEPLPSGDEWLHAAGLLALGSVELGDPTTAEAARSRLLPYADLLCGVGYRSFVGPVSFHLGRLSMLLGDWASAERHLTASLSVLGGRRARPWFALTQLSLARTLRARARPGDQSWAQVLEGEARTAVAGLGLRRNLS